jgi:putative membrane protein
MTTQEGGPMEGLLTSAQYVPLFFAYFGAGLVLFLIFAWVYAHVTPYEEMKLIREGNTAAAISYSGAILGFVLPLGSAIAHSIGISDMVMWGVIALAIQVGVYMVISRLIPNLAEDIPAGKTASATLLAVLSLSMGILSATCLTW